MPVDHVPAGSSDDGFVRSPSGVLVPAVIDPFHRALHHVAPAGLVGQTTQTAGMRRLEAISGKTVGARNLWMGQTHVPASTASANHHHGDSETAIYVVSGNPVFVFLDVDGEEPVETRIETGPGVDGSTCAQSRRSRLTTIASWVVRAMTTTASVPGSGFSSRCGTNGGTKT